MEMVTLANKQVSRICLGTWAIGGWLWGGTDEKDAINTIHAAFNSGINMIDTAPAYGSGKSEEIIGKAISTYGKREQIFLATKAGIRFENGDISRDSSALRIEKECNDSLKRLGTDYIDLYQIHWPDEKVTLAETGTALAKLLKDGKIRSVGVSNFSIAQIDEINQFVPITTSQPPYNMFERAVENEILPYTEKKHITTLAYSTLCRGLLTGKITTETKYNGDDLRKDIDPKFRQPLLSQYLNTVKALDDYAKEKYQKNVMALAMRWVLDRGQTIALCGARNPNQVSHFNAITGFKLDQAAMQDIDKILAQHITKPVDPEFMAPPQ